MTRLCSNIEGVLGHLVHPQCWNTEKIQQFWSENMEYLIPAINYAKMLTSSRRSLKTTYSSMDVHYIRHLSQADTDTSVPSLCRLDLTELATALTKLDSWLSSTHQNIYARRNEHVHITHYICPYTNDSCRCLWVRRRSRHITKSRKRGLRRITRAINLESADYVGILRYLSAGARLVEGDGGHSEYEKLCDGYQHLSVCIVPSNFKPSSNAHLL